MALIDEYKQAIQDVPDGRAKEAPRPSELPWTEDKAATMWAAAAAELIAEDNAPEPSSGGGELAIKYTRSGSVYSTTTTYADIKAALENDIIKCVVTWGNYKLTGFLSQVDAGGTPWYYITLYPFVNSIGKSDQDNHFFVQIYEISIQGDYGNAGPLAAPTIKKMTLDVNDLVTNSSGF